MFVQITANDWAFAALIGEARRRSNENKRNSTRDRGYEKNIHVDLMGSLGEVLAYKSFKQLMLPETERKYLEDIFKTDGGSVMKGADLLFDSGVRHLSLDIKTYDCAPNKRFFAINANKHEKLNGCCHGYLCVLFAKYGKVGYIVNHVPYGDVSHWQKYSLGKYGDPSYNFPVQQFVNTYGEKALIHKLVQEGAFAKDEVRAAIYNSRVMERFGQLVPEYKAIFKKSA